ncbi:CYTH domain-containing protein [Candidatus Woesearchaeota archaeon]|nr:CYTH domain-containing protein [Candidatus Woesearchaeota archaeon]
MNIEVEIKVFISEEKYFELLDFFRVHGEFLKEDYQETYYFDADVDLRIQRNDYFSKLVLKKGNIHDYQREEYEVKFDRNEFEKLEKMFLALGYKVAIKWFRKRHDFRWEDIEVSVDFTRGYGYILELERKSDEINKELDLQILKDKLAKLDLELTPREEFDRCFNHYKENWQKLV